jgi:hypothetical protein
MNARYKSRMQDLQHANAAWPIVGRHNRAVANVIANKLQQTCFGWQATPHSRSIHLLQNDLRLAATTHAVQVHVAIATLHSSHGHNLPVGLTPQRLQQQRVTAVHTLLVISISATVHARKWCAPHGEN